MKNIPLLVRVGIGLLNVAVLAIMAINIWFGLGVAALMAIVGGICAIVGGLADR